MPFSPAALFRFSSRTAVAYSARVGAASYSSSGARSGTTREMANCVLFLVSDAASYVSGQVFCVDGAATIDSLKLAL